MDLGFDICKNSGRDISLLNGKKKSVMIVLPMHFGIVKGNDSVLGYLSKVNTNNPVLKIVTNQKKYEFKGRFVTPSSKIFSFDCSSKKQKNPLHQQNLFVETHSKILCFDEDPVISTVNGTLEDIDSSHFITNFGCSQLACPAGERERIDPDGSASDDEDRDGEPVVRLSQRESLQRASKSTPCKYTVNSDAGTEDDSDSDGEFGKKKKISIKRSSSVGSVSESKPAAVVARSNSTPVPSSASKPKPSSKNAVEKKSTLSKRSNPVIVLSESENDEVVVGKKRKTPVKSYKESSAEESDSSSVADIKPKRKTPVKKPSSPVKVLPSSGSKSPKKASKVQSSVKKSTSKPKPKKLPVFDFNSEEVSDLSDESFDDDDSDYS